MKRYFLIITLLITNISYSAEEQNTQEKSSNQGWSSYINYFGIVDYFADLYNKMYNWILSWTDTRTAEQKIKDEETNTGLFNQELEYADALITNAEKQHPQVMQKLKSNSGLTSTQTEIEKRLKSLEKLRKDLALLEPRFLLDYAKNAALGIIANFKDIPGFNPNDVYKYLATQFIQQNILKPEEIPSTSTGLSLTQVEKKKDEQLASQAVLIQSTFPTEAIFNTINKLIQDQIKLGKDYSNSPELQKLRQILYLFQSDFAKQQFDAFLKGDKVGGLFSLQINDASGEILARIQDLKERLLMIKAELEQDMRAIKAKLEKTATPSPSSSNVKK